MKFINKMKTNKIVITCLIIAAILIFMIGATSLLNKSNISFKNLFANVYSDEVATLTIGLNANISDNLSVDEDVSFTYVIKINDILYDGTASSLSDDSKTYEIKNGELTIPYNERVAISVKPKDKYDIVRKTYDNDKYALIKEEEISGVIENKYYKTEDDVKKEITKEEYDKETNNGQNKEIKKYVDKEGNSFEESQLEEKSGVEVKKSTGLSTTYAFENYGPQKIVKDSLKTYTFKVNINSNYTETKTLFITTYKYSGTAKAETDYEMNLCQMENECVSLEDEISKSESTSHSPARKTFHSNVITSIGRLAYRITDETIKTKEPNKIAILKDDLSKIIPGDTDGAWDRNEEKNYETQIYVFTPVTLKNIIYDEESSKYKDVTFNVDFKKAPTGEFVVDFMLYDGVIPISYEDAKFLIKDSNGKSLSENDDYTLTKENKNINILSATYGYTVYKFSGLKHGNYTISQEMTKPGYICDTKEYAFEVKRLDGSVIGENFSKSDFDNNLTALTNNTWSLIKKYKVFKNNTITIEFSKVDQNDDAVSGANFLMIEKDATLNLIKSVSNNLLNNNLQEMIKELTNTDWSNVDEKKLIQVILEVILANSNNLDNITIPAILKISSDENGIVSINNSSNIFNAIDLVIGNNVSGEKLAEIIEKNFAGMIDDETLNKIKNLGSIKINTGIPHASYILLETDAPFGYAKTPVIYTIKVSKDGTAVSRSGVLIPTIVDTINDRYNIDLSNVIISQEEFNKLSKNVKDAFGTFDKYQSIVIDTISDLLGDYVDTKSLKKIKESINDLYNEYDDFSTALEKTFEKFNNVIGGDVSKDWKVYDYRYFVDIDVKITDCKGNKIDNLPYKITDLDGNEYILNENGKVTVPYGTYKINVEYSNDKYLLIDNSILDINVNDVLEKYEFNVKFHNKKKVKETKKEANCTEDEVVTELIKCSICNEVLETLETYSVPNTALGHESATPVKENVIEATCDSEGSYDSVVYCKRCNHELKREKVIIPKLNNCLKPDDNLTDTITTTTTEKSKTTTAKNKTTTKKTVKKKKSDVTSKKEDENPEYITSNDKNINIILKANDKDTKEIKLSSKKDNYYNMMFSYTGKLELVGWTTNLSSLGYEKNVDYKMYKEKNNLVIEFITDKAKEEIYTGNVIVNAKVESKTNITKQINHKKGYDLLIIIIILTISSLIVLSRKLILKKY